MADLIDRDKVLETIFNVMSDNKVVHKHRALNRNIKQIPKANTERHAHWIQDKDITELTLTCNCCGYSYIEADPNCEERYDFCPNCGCKMDEVEDETQNN